MLVLSRGADGQLTSLKYSTHYLHLILLSSYLTGLCRRLVLEPGRDQAHTWVTDILQINLESQNGYKVAPRQLSATLTHEESMPREFQTPKAMPNSDSNITFMSHLRVGREFDPMPSLVIDVDLLMLFTVSNYSWSTYRLQVLMPSLHPVYVLLVTFFMMSQFTFSS